MSQICAICGPETLYGDEVPFCPIHIGPLEHHEPSSGDASTRDAPQSRAPQSPAPSRLNACWSCGAEPHPSNTECVVCHRSLTPPALVIRFRDGTVELDRGSQVELGREGRYTRLFRSFRNVSRHHAVVGVDADGRAWIEANPTPNGTFVNQREIAPSVRRTLESDQVVRFALHAEGTVTVYPNGGVRT